MSGIKTIDLLLVTDLFEPKGSAGYILNFNDRSFAQFFAQEPHVDIDDPAYAKNGASKGKRLRYFLQAIDDPTAVQRVAQGERIATHICRGRGQPTSAQVWLR